MKSVKLNIEFEIEDNIADAINSDIENGSFTNQLMTLLFQAYSGGRVVMPSELEAIIADLMDDIVDDEEDGEDELSERETELIASTVESVLSKILNTNGIDKIIAQSSTNNTIVNSMVYSDSAQEQNTIEEHKSNIVRFNNDEVTDIPDDGNNNDAMSDEEADDLADLFGF